MLGDFIYSSASSAEAQARAKTIADESPKYSVPGKFEKSVRSVLIFAAIFILLGIVWFFAITPLRPFALIDVRGFPGFGKYEALAFAGITSGASYVSLNAAEAQQRLAGHHLVESVRVIKTFPDRLSIFLEPRQAVAVILAEVSGTTRPVFVDRYAVPFKIGNNTPLVSPSWLPVVSGISIGTSRLGARLSSDFAPLFARLGAITDEAPELWQAVSEINIVERNFGIYDLLVFPINSQVRLRMSGDISAENLRYALLMLDVFRRENIFSGEIDIRSGIGVVRP